MSQIISYQPRVAPPLPSEFDYHFDAELARRLRRRFLWYCGLTIVLTLALLLPGLIGGVRGTVNDRPVQAPAAVEAINYGSSLLSLLMYVAAFAVVVARPFRRESLLKLALWLYVLASIPGLIGLRLVFQLVIPSDMADRALADLQQGYEASAAASQNANSSPTTSNTRQPADDSFLTGFKAGLNQTAPNRATTQAVTTRQNVQVRSLLATVLEPAFLFAGLVPPIMLFQHSFACLFIPWTLRQSLAPAWMLLGLLLVILLVDLGGGGLPWQAVVVFVPLTALSFVPGSAFCWWRFSRMRRQIRLNFESDRFRSLQTELAGARRILETALPAPRTTGPARLAYVYEPMRQIGGDLLFVHPPPDTAAKVNPQSGALHAVLLDVTGHGIAAALTVNRLVGELERLFAECERAGPGEVLSALNEYVYYTMARHDIYVTAIAMQLETRINRLIYASAGQPPAYLVSRGGNVTPLASTTLLLGVVEGKQFVPDATEVPMGPGDAVVAYTDGASETMRDGSGDMLGMRGIRALVEEIARELPDPAVWPNELMRRVAGYRNAPPADDTLIVALYRPSGDAPPATPHASAII